MAAEAVFSSVLRELLSKLSSLVQNEIGLLWGLEEEKRKLESYLSVIGAVLHDAERRQVNEMAVRDWLRKLRYAAYDAEDLVDDFVYEARRRKVVNQQGMRKKVRNLFSLSNPLTFRLKMAHKMQELRKRFDDIAKERNDFHFKVEAVESRPPISRARETCSYVIESEVYGRGSEAEKLVHSLINSENEEVLSVIPIVGMGGLGKTTLAQLVYNDERVRAHFGLKMWVHVSEHFDAGRLLKEILESASKKTADQLSIDLLQARLRQELSGKKYLLVLDDVWNEEPNEWSKLNTWLKCGGMGSKILATTRSDKVASTMSTLPAHKLGYLSEEDSWTLFEKLARPHPNFVSIGKEMVDKCGGLPLAVKTLGGLMSSKTTQSEWELVRNSELWKPQVNDGGILPVLRLSYDHLTPSLKQCFLYCAIIPKGCEIEKNKLIKQWIAHGFIHSDGENELLEEKGAVDFNELLQRSLFHVKAKSHVKFLPWYILNDEKQRYYMHDLIHDLLRFIVGKEYSFVDASMESDPEVTRHLSSQYWNKRKELKSLEALKICKKLRTVALPREVALPDYFCDVNVFSGLRSLRVLNLSGSEIRYLPNSIDKLKHLRYLDISYTLIEELPESICNLHSLQTLILNGRWIKKFPKNMMKMISLRHVEFESYHSTPKGIRELTCLRTWPVFVVRKDIGAGIEELKGLNLLSGDIRIIGLENISNGVCAREANLKAKKYLDALVLSWSHIEASVDIEGNSQEVIENLEPHPNVKTLVVFSYMGPKFPDWMMMLTNLVNIELSHCNRCEHLPPLWHLRLLQSLKMENMGAMKYIFEFDGGHSYQDTFPSLKQLWLYEMPILEEWSSQASNGGEQLIFDALRTLKICDCPNLICFPGVLVSAPQKANGKQVVFPRLEELQVEKCPKIVHFPHLLPSLNRLVMSAVNQTLLGSVANYTSLSSLFIEGFPEVKYLPEEFGPNHPRLQTLKIIDCPKLMSLSNQLGNLYALETLVIEGCIDLVISLPDGGLQQQQHPPLKSLRTLFISNSCERQISLPGDGIVLTSLLSLYISSCKNIESLSNDMLQNLTELQISDCPKVFPLENLQSLEYLAIMSCKDATNFRSLTSLTRLYIGNFPGMRALPEWVTDVTSLTWLAIYHCPQIATLPESLQHLTNLRGLEIFDCPILKRGVRCNKGQDWHKVAHVANIQVDGKDVRDCHSSDEHPSLMDSLKMGANIFNKKKLLLPSCCSSRPSSSSSSSSPRPPT